MSTPERFMETVQAAVDRFPGNRMCARLDAGAFTMPDYHAILLMIFHQTFEGPSTFALAGAHCAPRRHEVRDYLLHHADEEKAHWQWVINDLRRTGYAGPDPRDLFPQPACQAYIAFNVYTALRNPMARLAIAATLESIGATHGKNYATRLCRHLALEPAQASFFFGHGDTDVGHTADILGVLSAQDLDEEDWDWMCHAARTSGALYTAMYDEAIA